MKVAHKHTSAARRRIVVHAARTGALAHNVCDGTLDGHVKVSAEHRENLLGCTEGDCAQTGKTHRSVICKACLAILNGRKP